MHNVRDHGASGTLRYRYCRQSHPPCIARAFTTSLRSDARNDTLAVCVLMLQDQAYSTAVAALSDARSELQRCPLRTTCRSFTAKGIASGSDQQQSQPSSHGTCRLILRLPKSWRCMPVTHCPAACIDDGRCATAGRTIVWFDNPVAPQASSKIFWCIRQRRTTIAAADKRQVQR